VPQTSLRQLSEYSDNVAKIYFGLKNDGTPFGFTVTDSTVRDVSRKIFEAIRPQIIPTAMSEILDGREVIVVEFQGDDVPYPDSLFCMQIHFRKIPLHLKSWYHIPTNRRRGLSLAFSVC